MKKLALIAGATLAAVSSPALAQEESSTAGPFIGVVGGYDSLSVDDGNDSGSTDGAVYGVTVGYDTVSGDALFGIEAEITDSTAGQTTANVLTNGDSASIDAGRDIYAGVRLGYIIENGTVIYFKGGYSNARIAFDYDNGAGNVVEFGDNLDGLRLGAGVETQVSGFTVRAEYRYSEYESFELLGTPTPFKFEHNQAVIVLGRKF